MATPLQRKDFEARCTRLRERLCDPDFLANKGLGNEVGIFTFCYDPTLELEARDFFGHLVLDAQHGKYGTSDVRVDLHQRNLYDLLLQICEGKRILDRLPAQEERRGQSAMLRQLQRIATPEAYVVAMDWDPHTLGDVLLITGVGEVYPFMRVHNILNNMQSTFRDVPVVVAYPGTYDGRSLSLFSKLADGNYYRAFDLI
ncbi:MAG: DUF1788 domain-containing protein [Atopobiaceae bacterium]|nr:DUF1788 domain-containing protein [Atopobiaceae bacterium]